jgi:hypothetical protein
MLGRITFEMFEEGEVEHSFERVPVVDQAVFHVRLYLHARVGRLQAHRVEQVALARLATIVHGRCRRARLADVHAVRFVVHNADVRGKISLGSSISICLDCQRPRNMQPLQLTLGMSSPA